MLLTRRHLDHESPTALHLLVGRQDVLLVYATAAVVNEDGAEAEFLGVERGGGYESGKELDKKEIPSAWIMPTYPPTQTSVAIPQTNTSVQPSLSIKSSRQVFPRQLLSDRFHCIIFYQAWSCRKKPNTSPHRG